MPEAGGRRGSNPASTADYARELPPSQREERSDGARSPSQDQTKKARKFGPLSKYQFALLAQRMPTGPLRHNLASTFRQLLGLGQKLQRFGHLRISFRPHLQPFLLPKNIHKYFALDAGPHPGVVFQQLCLGVRNLLVIKELAEIQQDHIVHLESLGG